MVHVTLISTASEPGFQYSLCRVVLMVMRRYACAECGEELSVLALSSRFDGLRDGRHGSTRARFQYSLCRVVLMVPDPAAPWGRTPLFQYSLCRVVLMVDRWGGVVFSPTNVSVLALSSRFDGQCCPLPWASWRPVSVLALSSRFDGHLSFEKLVSIPLRFSTRSVESF